MHWYWTNKNDRRLTKKLHCAAVENYWPKMGPESLRHVELQFAAGQVREYALDILQHLQVVVLALVCLNYRLFHWRTIIVKQILRCGLFKRYPIHMLASSRTGIMLTTYKNIRWLFYCDIWDYILLGTESYDYDEHDSLMVLSLWPFSTKCKPKKISVISRLAAKWIISNRNSPPSTFPSDAKTADLWRLVCEMSYKDATDHWIFIKECLLMQNSR